MEEDIIVDEETPFLSEGWDDNHNPGVRDDEQHYYCCLRDSLNTALWAGWRYFSIKIHKLFRSFMAVSILMGTILVSSSTYVQGCLHFINLFSYNELVAALTIRVRVRLTKSIAHTVFGTVNTRLGYYLCLIRFWMTWRNNLVLALILILIQILTGAISEFVIHLLGWFILIISFVIDDPIVSMTLVIIIAITYILSSSLTFRFWIYSVFVVTTYDHPKMNMKGIKKAISQSQNHDVLSPSHPHSCEERNISINACARLAEKFNRRPYFVGKSRRIHEMGYAGSTYSFKNEMVTINAPELYHLNSDDLSPDDLLCMVDRDYYCDMSEVLMLCMPICLYTFDPIKPADTTAEYQYHIAQNGNVVGKIEGGTPWDHPLWLYNDDKIVVSKYGVQVSYKIFRYRFSTPHSFILLKPLGVTFALEERLLRHRDHVFGGTRVVRSFDGDGSRVFYSTEGSWVSHELRDGVWDQIKEAIKARATKNGTVTVSAPHILEALETLGYGKDEDNLLDSEEMHYAQMTIYTAFCLYDFNKNDDECEPFAFNLHFSKRVDKRAVEVQDIYIEDTKAEPPMVIALTDVSSVSDFENVRTGIEQKSNTPLIENAVFPARTKTNMFLCHSDRVHTPQLDALRRLDEDFYYKVLIYSKEFIGKFLRGKKLHRCDDEEVVRRMNRPTQRKEYEDAMKMLYEDGRTEVFQKAEGMGSSPRPITTKKGVRKWIFAGYVYPMTEIFKEQDWYAFGRTPEAVADRVAYIASHLDSNDMIGITDYNKFDGHVQAIIRYLVQELYLEAYSHDDQYVIEIKDLLKDTYLQLAIADCGDGIVKFLKGFEQESGDQNTSNVGSFTNAFISYVAHREDGFSPDVAYERLGLYGGDDGLTKMLKRPDEKRTILEVSSKMGMDIDLEDARETGYVKFLSRIYSPLVWKGDNNSCTDVFRQLKKIFTCERRGFARPLKLWQKCFSHWLNDKNTPILGELIGAILDVLNPFGFQKDFESVYKECDTVERMYSISKEHGLSHWGVHAYVKNSGFPNSNDGNWMEAFVTKNCATFDIESFYVHIASAHKVAMQRLQAVFKTCDITKMSAKKKLQMADWVVAPFVTYENSFGFAPIATKEGRKVLVRYEDEETVCDKTNGENTLKDEINDISKSLDPDMVNKIALYDKIKDEMMYPNLTEGARKCLLVACKFVEDVKQHCDENGLKYKNCHLIYSGAAGLDACEAIAVLRTLSFCRLYMFDPGWSTDINCPILDKIKKWKKDTGDKTVVIREARFNDKEMAQIVTNATKKGENEFTFPIFWLDDAYVESDYSAKFLQSKFDILTKYHSKIEYCSLKIKGAKEVKTNITNLGLYHTPTNVPGITTVHEVRANGRPILGDPMSPFVDQYCDHMNAFRAQLLLHRYYQKFLEDGWDKVAIKAVKDKKSERTDRKRPRLRKTPGKGKKVT